MPTVLCPSYTPMPTVLCPSIHPCLLYYALCIHPFLSLFSLCTLLLCILPMLHHGYSIQITLYYSYEIIIAWRGVISGILHSVGQRSNYCRSRKSLLTHHTIFNHKHPLSMVRCNFTIQLSYMVKKTEQLFYFTTGVWETFCDLLVAETLEVVSASSVGLARTKSGRICFACIDHYNFLIYIFISFCSWINLLLH